MKYILRKAIEKALFGFLGGLLVVTLAWLKYGFEASIPALIGAVFSFLIILTYVAVHEYFSIKDLTQEVEEMVEDIATAPTFNQIAYMTLIYGFRKEAFLESTLVMTLIAQSHFKDK